MRARFVVVVLLLSGPCAARAGEGAQPDRQATVRPGAGSGGQSGAHSAAHADEQFDSQSDDLSGAPPEERSGARSGTRPLTQSGAQPDAASGPQPSSRSASRSGERAEGRSGTGAGALSLTLPQSYDFHQDAHMSPAADAAKRLKTAPLPDPGTVPRPDTSLHDANTGADTSAFGTAYSYANPLYGTQSGSGINGAVSKSAGLPQTTGGIVLFEWGFPPPPMPRVPGEDLTQAPLPVAQINFAVQADNEAVLDSKALATILRAVQSYGRAGLTVITIERPAYAPGCCGRYPDLVRAELIRSGLGPGHLLPGHRIRIVLATLPVSH